MLFRSNDTATTEIYTTRHTLSLHDALPIPPCAHTVEPEIGPDDQCFEDYPDETLEDWHRAHGLWID